MGNSDSISSAQPGRAGLPANRGPPSVANLLRILEQQKQLLQAQWRRDEAEAGVKASRVFVQRMGEDRSYAGLLSDQQRPPDRVLQHADTDAKPLVIGGDGKPGQDDHRQREATHALTQALWCFRSVDLAHGEAEIAGDAIVLVGDDKRSGRVAGLGLPGMVYQSVVQGGLTAIKALKPELNVQRLGISSWLSAAIVCSWSSLIAAAGALVMGLPRTSGCRGPSEKHKQQPPLHPLPPGRGCGLASLRRADRCAYNQGR